MLLHGSCVGPSGPQAIFVNVLHKRLGNPERTSPFRYTPECNAMAVLNKRYPDRDTSAFCVTYVCVCLRIPTLSHHDRRSTSRCLDPLHEFSTNAPITNCTLSVPVSSSLPHRILIYVKNVSERSNCTDNTRLYFERSQ